MALGLIIGVGAALPLSEAVQALLVHMYTDRIRWAILDYHHKFKAVWEREHEGKGSHGSNRNHFATTGLSVWVPELSDCHVFGQTLIRPIARATRRST